jgi:FkbM family methyltransferase
VNLSLKPYGTDEQKVSWDLPVNGQAVRLHLDRNKPTQRYISDHLAGGYLYEVEAVQALFAALEKGGAFFDVGANCGYFSALMSPLASSVLSFEPSADNCAALAINAPTAEIVNAAVSDKRGLVSLFTNLDNDGGHALWKPGAHPFNQRTREQYDPSQYVTAVVMDDYADRQPVTIKIDTEGAEWHVLNGARAILAQPQLRLVVCERNDFGLANMGRTAEEVVALMAEYDFHADAKAADEIGNWHFYK